MMLLLLLLLLGSNSFAVCVMGEEGQGQQRG